MKTNINLKTKKKSILFVMILSLFISQPVTSQIVDIVPFDGICPDGLVYNPGYEICDWDFDEVKTYFKPPVQRVVTTTFRVARWEMTFTVANYDFYECSREGTNERCACSAVGMYYLFTGYSRYTLC